MGCNDSQLLPPMPGGTSTHSIVSFPTNCNHDEMVLMYNVSDLKDVFDSAIKRRWSKGLQRFTGAQDDLVIFKMRGSPFSSGAFGSLKRTAANTRFMIALLEDSMRHGWTMRAMVNLYRESKTESLVLGRIPIEGMRPVIGALALCSSDMIVLVNLPGHLHDTLVHLTEEHWPQGIKSMKHLSHNENFGLQTKSWPFRASDIGANLNNSRMLLLNLIRAIYEAGYEFYGSGHPDHDAEAVGTLYFAQSKSPKGAPQMFLLAPHQKDTIITVAAPDMCIGVLRQCILRNWLKQIQQESSHKTLHAIKMNGYPFWPRDKRAVEITLVLIHTFEELRRIGWRLAATFDATKSIDDTSTFLLMQDTPKKISMMALRLSGHRNLSLVNAPEEIENAVRNELHAAVPAVISEQDVDTAVKFTIDRNLWNAQPVVCLVIAKIEESGWRLVSSADLSAKFVQTKDTRFPVDLHTLFFERI